MKKILLLGLLCTLLMVCGTAAAQEPFAFDPDTGTITAYTGGEAVVTVPESIGGVPVRALGRAVFDQNNTVKEVTLPEGLTHILYNAFYFCENLEAVHLPSTLQAIDSYAFFSCGKLTTINLPPALVYIDDNAFAHCGALVDVRFTGAVPFIASTAFLQVPEGRRYVVPVQEQAAYEAMLGTVCIPEGDVQAIAPDTQVLFDPATGAVTGYAGYSADVAVPASIEGTPVTAVADRAFLTNQWVRRLTLPEGITSIGKQAFFGSTLGAVTLPGTLKSIGEEAFAAAQLMTLQLPNSLVDIGPSAFANGRFSEVTVPEGVTIIPEKAFSQCWKLETLMLPASLQQIGPQAFAGNNMLSYIVFAGNTPPDMAPDAFLDCVAIADIDIAWDADKKAAEAFQQAFTALGLPDGQFTVWRANPPGEPPYPVTATFVFDETTQLISGYKGTMDSMTMFWDHWKQDGSATLPVKGLGAGAFEGSTMKHFSVPHSNAFEIIGERAFADSQLESIYLFDSVTVIGREAFRGCVNLKEVVLPDSVQRIGEGAFKGCDSLERVVLPAGAELAGDLGLKPETVFITKDATDEQVTAMAASLDYPWYLTLPRVGEQSSFVPMPDTYVPNPEADFDFDPDTGAITGYSGSANVVVVPRAIGGVPVTAIQYPGFSNLTVLSVAQGTQDNVSLQQVILPETIRTISDSAFLSCTSLQRVDCYGPVDLVGIRAFEMCTSLTDVVFYNNVRELGLYAFNKCESLQTVQLGTKLAALPEGAFWGCGFAGELALDVPDIGPWAYKDCPGITAVRVSPAVQSIGDGVFQGMTALETVTFDRADPAILKDSTMPFDPTLTNLTLVLPADTPQDTVAAFESILQQNMLPSDGRAVLATP